MVEELKILAELLAKVSDNAVYGVIAYMILDTVKAPIVVLTIGKAISMVIDRFRVSKIEEKKDI